jgi:hypothetical protein
MLFYPSPERKIKKKMNLSIKTIIYIDLVAGKKDRLEPGPVWNIGPKYYRL